MQVPFLKEISEILKAASRTEQNYPIIIGGNFNVIHDPDLERLRKISLFPTLM